MSAIGMIAAAGAQMGVNYGVTKLNNEIKREEDEYARERNYSYGVRAQMDANRFTEQLYNRLYSPQAQIQQLKAAGLSPSLFYGDGGGIAGQASATNTGVGTINNSTFGINPLELSQIQLNNAQARKLNAEADTENGTNERGEQEIKKLTEEIGNIATNTKNTEEQTALLKLQQDLQDMTNNVFAETYVDHINEIKAKSLNAIHNADIAAANLVSAKMDAAEKVKTFNDRVKIAHEQLNLIKQQIATQKQQRGLMSAQTKAFHQQVSKMHYDMEMEYRDCIRNDKYYNLEAKYKHDLIVLEEWARKQKATDQQIEEWKAEFGYLTSILCTYIGTAKISF